MINSILIINLDKSCTYDKILSNILILLKLKSNEKI